jgi:hypothetical protein
VGVLAPGCIQLPDKAFSCEQDEDCAKVGGEGEPYVCRGNVCVQPGSDGGSDAGGGACSQASVPMPCLGDGGWCWDNPLSAGSPLFAIRGRSETDIWAVGAGGVALHWDGQCWARSATGRTEELRGIWPTSGQTWWAVGENGLLLQWDGSHWTAGKLGGAMLRDIEGSSGTSAFAVGDGGSVLAFDGQQWSAQDAGLSRNLNSVWPVSSGEAWAFAEDGSIFHGVNGAWTQDPFSPKRSTPFVSAVGLADGGILAVGMGSLVRREGTAWTQSDFATSTTPLNGVWHDSNLTWIVGPPSAIYLADGSTESSGTPRVLNAVWSLGEKAWAVGEAGAIVQRSESRWSEVPGGVARGVRGLWLASDGLWAAGESGLLMRRVDGLWRSVPPPASDTFEDIWASGDLLLVLGSGGKVYAFKNGQWSTESAASSNLNALWGAGPDDVWAVGDNGVIRRRRSDGTWGPESGASSNIALNALWGSSATDVWAVGSNGVIYHRGASCTSSACWTLAYFTGTTNALLGVWGTGPRSVWAVGNSGVIYYFNGDSWKSQQSAGSSPTLNAVSGRDEGHVWAVGDDGAILFWDGNTWSTQAVGLGRSLRAVGVTPDTVWAGGLNGTILKNQ